MKTKIRFYGLGHVLIVILLAGCTMFAPDIRTETTYTLFVPPPLYSPDVRVPLRIGLERVEGRTIYRQRNITVRPHPTLLDRFSDAQWSETPIDMLSETVYSYLAPISKEITKMPARHADPLDVLLSLYIDRFDLHRREGRWYADARVKYEIICAKQRSLIKSGWVTETHIADSVPDIYVAAQVHNITAICEEVARVLAEVSATR